LGANNRRKGPPTRVLGVFLGGGWCVWGGGFWFCFGEGEERGAASTLQDIPNCPGKKGKKMDFLPIQLMDKELKDEESSV